MPFILTTKRCHLFRQRKQWLIKRSEVHRLNMRKFGQDLRKNEVHRLNMRKFGQDLRKNHREIK